MTLSDFVDAVVLFGQDNPIVALVAAVVFLFLLYKKPKLVLSTCFLILILASLFYFIMDLSSSTKAEKERMIHKAEEGSEVDKK